MGSAPSRTQVKTIALSQGPSSASVASISARSPEAWACADTNRDDRTVELEEQLTQSKAKYSDAEERAKASEKQAESLREEVEKLCHQLGAATATVELQAQKIAAVDTQDEHIRKLGEQLTASKQEVMQMRERFGRKLKKVRAASAKTQAESALALFELREENSKLVEENGRLLEQVRKSEAKRQSLLSSQGRPSSHQQDSSKQTECQRAVEAPAGGASDGGGHMKLILELSQQVSALDEELRTAHETIRKFETRDQTGGQCDQQIARGGSKSASSSTGYFSLESSECSL